MEEQRRQLDKDLAVLEAKLELWMKDTDDFRERLTTKIDNICRTISVLADKISALPCPVREERANAMCRQLNLMWGLLSAVVVAVIIKYING